MAKKMLIDATHPEETRVVVVDGNKVDDFDFESINKRQLAGNIYLAKVTRVEPSLQAAFVEYGGNRHGFLAFAEIHPDYYQIPVADREALLREEEALQRDQENGVETVTRGRPAAAEAVEAGDAENAKDEGRAGGGKGGKPRRNRRSRGAGQGRPGDIAGFDAIEPEDGGLGGRGGAEPQAKTREAAADAARAEDTATSETGIREVAAGEAGRTPEVAEADAAAIDPARDLPAAEAPEAEAAASPADVAPVDAGRSAADAAATAAADMKNIGGAAVEGVDPDAVGRTPDEAGEHVPARTFGAAVPAEFFGDRRHRWRRRRCRWRIRRHVGGGHGGRRCGNPSVR